MNHEPWKKIFDSHKIHQHKFEKILKNKTFHFLAFFILSFLAYQKLIFAPKTLNPDAYLILPFFDKINDISDYLLKLIKFETLDFQPVRDLSLFIDWWIWKKTNLNTFIFQNVIIWSYLCLQIEEFLKRLCPRVNSLLVFGICMGFCVYPLFSGVIGWGIARKHLLSTLFILLSFNYFLDFMSNHRKKNGFGFILFYLLANLTQPIHLLFPFFCVLYSWLYYLNKKNQAFRVLAPTLFISLIFILINYFYYSKSGTFAFAYMSKFSDALIWEEKLFSFGHYLFQIFFPYRLAFQYDHHFKFILLGYVAFFFLVFAYTFSRQSIKKLLLWLVFTFSPILIILNTPKLLMDSYLVLPSLGITFILLETITHLSPRINQRFCTVLLLILVIFWTFQTRRESSLWANPKVFAEKNFERVPSCINAIRLARVEFSHSLPMSSGVKSYLERNVCFSVDTELGRLEHQVFLSQAVYFDHSLKVEQKIELLNKLNMSFFYPSLIKAALLLSIQQKSAAEQIITEVVNNNQTLVLDTPEDPIIPKTIYPYCLSISYEGCIKFTGQIKTERIAPYF